MNTKKSEDHLENLFAAALGVAPEKAKRVFAVVRGLEAKLEAVTEALSDADAQTIARWGELKKRVSQAAEIPQSDCPLNASFNFRPNNSKDRCFL